MKNKNILIVLVIVVAIVIISFFGTAFNKKDSLVNIRVADPRAIGGALFHIALENGYFTDKGLKIEILGVQTGDEAIKAVLSNSADIALGGIVPYSFLALNDQSIKIFATNAYVGDNQIIANKNKGIEKAEDLLGKKIAYTKTTASDIGVLQFLSAHKLKTSDVELINMKPLAMAAALQAGQIDAYSSWEPHILNGQKLLGDKAIVFDGKNDVYTWHQALMSKDKYISEHRSDLFKFVEALKMSEQFLNSQKEKSIALAAKHNSVAVDVLTKIWPRYDFSINLKDDLYSILKTDLLWANLQREKPVENIPSAQDLVDLSVLKYVKK